MALVGEAPREGLAVVIYIDVRHKPVSTNAAYKHTRFGRPYMSKEGKAFKEAIAVEARRSMAGRKPMEGGVRVLIDFWFETARSDVDGPTKLVLDALEGIVYTRDSQVLNYSVGKHKAPEKKHVGLVMTVHEQPMAEEVSSV